MSKTTYQNVFSKFALRSKMAVNRIEGWKKDPHYISVVPFVENHVTEALYKITSKDIEDVCKETEHALGEVRKSDINNIDIIRDWHPSFAFIHFFHYAIEHSGMMPTYQNFRKMCKEDNFLNQNLYIPAEKIVSKSVDTGYSLQKSKDALRWRIGNAYYSVLREVYTIVTLRELGFDINYHPLADALFAIDFWCEDIAVCLYVKNKFYKDNGFGRKLTSESIFDDANPPIKFCNITLEPAKTFGVVHIPSKLDIKNASELIKNEKRESCQDILDDILK